MYSTDEIGFERIVAWAIDEMPKTYTDNLKNVAITIEDNPSLEQRVKQNLRPNQTLFGLYEGIPLTKRNNNYTLVIPDKITIFKHPLEQFSRDLSDLLARVKNTVWHEIAHYYGLDHDRIKQIESKRTIS